MSAASWVAVATETTGLAEPIFVVELAAQRMRGWKPDGPPFRHLLNHGAEIPPEVSRVNGYTREILERDGESPRDVYRQFAEYVRDQPVCSYNLEYDWDQVLVPEWRRLGLEPVSTRGMCLLKLAQRLLDPVPAGNCKLQTLRQYYRLRERGPHTARGDVETVVELGRRVLRPLAEARGLNNWSALHEFSESTWYPARIRFGKFKGRMFRDASHDPALRAWLTWLAESANPRTAEMGRWYLAQVGVSAQSSGVLADLEDGASQMGTGVLVYERPDIARLKLLIESARARLAEVETAYSSERQAISSTQARLFELLRSAFQARDLLKVRLEYRRKYLETLMESGEEEAADVEQEFERARDQTNADYDHVAEESVKRKALSADEEVELKRLWRKLVKLYHPDRYMGEEDKRATYQKLMAEINAARESGDIVRMREIASDPEGFIARHGWSRIELADTDELDKLRDLYTELQIRIIECLELLNTLRESPECELHQQIAVEPDLLEEIANVQRQGIEAEIATLKDEIERVEAEIAVLAESG